MSSNSNYLKLSVCSRFVLTCAVLFSFAISRETGPGTILSKADLVGKQIGERDSKNSKLERDAYLLRKTKSFGGLFLMSTGGFVASTITAENFRKKYENNYTSYLEADNQNQIQFFFTQAEYYGRKQNFMRGVSIGSFIGMSVGGYFTVRNYIKYLRSGDRVVKKVSRKIDKKTFAFSQFSISEKGILASLRF